MKFIGSAAAAVGALVLTAGLALSASASDPVAAAEKTGPAAPIAMAADFDILSAPVPGTYKVGAIPGSEVVVHHADCVNGWRHDRTLSGRGGSHHANTVGWINNGC